jgi:hypothetical protein
MKFKVDENLPEEVACRAEGRAIITLDLGFANVVAYPPEGLPGIVVLRPARQSKPLVLELVERVVLPFLDKHTLAGRLWIAGGTRIRIHS